MDHVVNNSGTVSGSSDKKSELESFFCSYFLHNPEIYGKYIESKEHQDYISRRRIKESE